MIYKFNSLFVTLFGIGRISKIPGSIASLVTIIFLFFIFQILDLAPDLVLICLIVIFFVSLYSINQFIKNKENKDPKEIVIDEFIGQSIPCLWICYKLKVYGMLGTVASPPLLQSIIPFLIAFVSFRFFDILKPFPINMIDKKIKNGFGVVFDDVVAGVFAAIITHLLLSLIY